MKLFKHKQTPVYYTLEGKGFPVLLIHGFLENSSMWNDITNQLSKNYKVIRIDLPGHGLTPAHGYVHSMYLYAEICAELMSILNLSQVKVVGHSMGGYVGMELINLLPQTVEQLILLNSTSLPDSEERKVERNRAIQAIQKFPEAFVSMAVKNLFLPENHHQLSKEINHAIQEANKCSKQGIIATLEGLKSRRDHQKTMTDFNSKITLIAGKKDQVIKYPPTKELARTTKTRLVTLPSGHMSHLEYPSETLEIIINLMAG